jgi:two-component system, cell cycle sensor histidine kinase and response regulator CckA
MTSPPSLFADLDSPRTSGVVQKQVRNWSLITLGLALGTTLLMGLTTGLWGIAIGFSALLAVAAAVLTFLSARNVRATATSSPATTEKQLLETYPEAAAVSDAQGSILYANRKYGEMLGGYVAPLQMKNADTARETIAQALLDANMGNKGFARVQQGARLLRLSCQLLGGGQPTLSSTYLWRVFPPESDVLQTSAISLLQGRAGALISELDIALLAVDAQGRILGANAAFAEMTGATPDQLIGAPLSAWLRHVQGQLFFGAEGQPQRLVEARDAKLATEGGTIVGHVIEVRVVQANATVAAQALGADMPPAYLENLPLPLALGDRDGRILYANTAFRETCGGNATFDGRVVYPSDLVSDEDRAVVSDLVRRVGTGATARQRSLVRLRQNADEAVELAISPASSMSSRVGGVAVVMTLADNAERRKLEQQFAQAQKMNAVGQLAGGIAHDFNNILTAIGGFCELLLQRHPPGDASFSDINQILTNANRAASLVKQLLAYSRQQTLKPTTVNVTDLLSEQITTLKRLIGDQVRLDVQHGRDLGSVRVDQGQFYTVVMNLVVNARDAITTAGNGHGVISIRTSDVSSANLPKDRADVMAKGSYIAIEVRDTGTGIPADVLPKIFEPFFTTKDVGQGTGLGLSTVYGIVKQSNGYIFAHSKSGEGTAFTIYLPSYEDAVPEAVVAKPEPLQNLWGTGTILLVEDEDAVRAFAAKALERKGYTVLAAASGDEALELMEEHKDDITILVTDVVMPNMDGPTLAIKVREQRPDLPVLFMSGYAEEQLRKSLSSAFDTAHVSFLPKPFSLKDLVQTVKDVLARITPA